MPKSFLHLSSIERSKILRSLTTPLSRPSTILEKDVWVCWVLQALFTMPNRLAMAFKGGTSLSKVFGAISRFSEDVDITLDYRGLDGAFDPFADGLSKSRLKKFSEELKFFVREHVHNVIAPYFHTKLADEFGIDSYRISISDDGEQLRLYYPSVFKTANNYVGNSVLVEFGGRNITEPNEEHEVQPDIAKHIAALDFPRAQVNVLSPMRTFWEKATLIHVECQRDEFRSNSERLSRHWYDLAMLADLVIGHDALADRDLLADVIKHKKVFYNASYANYDACLVGQLRLLPNEKVMSALREDFQLMIDAGMFIENPPSFDAIINRLRTLEVSINEKIV